MLKTERTLATAGTPATEGTSTTVVTPEAKGMVTTAGFQQQQKSHKRHKCHKQLGRHSRGDDNNVETPGSEHKCQQQYDLSNIRMLA
jgi:hypothetical protein